VRGSGLLPPGGIAGSMGLPVSGGSGGPSLSYPMLLFHGSMLRCSSIRPSRQRICWSNSLSVGESDDIGSSRSSPVLAVDGFNCPRHASVGYSFEVAQPQQQKISPRLPARRSQSRSSFAGSPRLNQRSLRHCQTEASIGNHDPGCGKRRPSLPEIVPPGVTGVGDLVVGKNHGVRRAGLLG
jgi:hypothetical protein